MKQTLSLYEPVRTTITLQDNGTFSISVYEHEDDGCRPDVFILGKDLKIHVHRYNKDLDIDTRLFSKFVELIS